MTFRGWKLRLSVSYSACSWNNRHHWSTFLEDFVVLLRMTLFDVCPNFFEFIDVELIPDSFLDVIAGWAITWTKDSSLPVWKWQSSSELKVKRELGHQRTAVVLAMIEFLQKFSCWHHAIDGHLFSIWRWTINLKKKETVSYWKEHFIVVPLSVEQLCVAKGGIIRVDEQIFKC